MHNPAEDRPWEQLEALTEASDIGQLEEYLTSLTPSEASRAVSRLDEHTQTELFTHVEPDVAADVIEHMSDAQAADIVENLAPEQAAAILHELPSNELADLLTAMEEESADQVLDAMEPQEAADARQLAAYEAECAGGIMITEFVAMSAQSTVGEILDDLRGSEEYADYDVMYVYITSKGGRLTGVVPLRDLVFARANQPVREIMISSPVFVRTTASLDELHDFFDDHGFIGVPVVDEKRRLVGVVRRHDVEESLRERSGNNYLKTQGIVGGEELRSMPVITRSRRRLSWLSINIVLNIIAASVIAMYQDTLAAVIALAVFLPIISDMSGCSGNQAVAVSIRELSLGLVRPTELLRVWLKEIAVGIINGIALGILIGVAGWVWQGNVWVGIVAGAALMVNTVVAVSIGGLVPLVLKRFKMDPALASGPILTTITDICGFALVLGLATLWLDRLTGA